MRTVAWRKITVAAIVTTLVASVLAGVVVQAEVRRFAAGDQPLFETARATDHAYPFRIPLDQHLRRDRWMRALRIRGVVTTSFVDACPDRLLEPDDLSRSSAGREWRDAAHHWLSAYRFVTRPNAFDVASSLSEQRMSSREWFWCIARAHRVLNDAAVAGDRRAIVAVENLRGFAVADLPLGRLLGLDYARDLASSTSAKAPASTEERELVLGTADELASSAAGVLLDLVWIRQVEIPPPAPPRLTFLGVDFLPIPAGVTTLGMSAVGPAGADEIDQDADVTQEKQRRFAMDGGVLMSRTEVTQESYASVLGQNPSSVQDPSLPVHGLTLVEAKRFCLVLSRLAREQGIGYRFRLPTEDEWEYACRAATRAPIAVSLTPTNRRVFADRLPEVAWFESNLGPGGVGPFPVASLAPNQWGLYDCHGNVAEWCLPSGALPAISGELGVVRGGGWATNYAGCRSSNRDVIDGATRSDNVGFRVIGVAER